MASKKRLPFAKTQDLNLAYGTDREEVVRMGIMDMQEIARVAFDASAAYSSKAGTRYNRVAACANQELSSIYYRAARVAMGLE